MSGAGRTRRHPKRARSPRPGATAPLSKRPNASGFFWYYTNVSISVDFRSRLRGSVVSPDMERHTPAGLRLGAYASESETPAHHFKSLKGIIFWSYSGARRDASTKGLRRCGPSCFPFGGHRPPLQFAFQMILLSMLLPFFRQFTEYLHDMN